MKFRSENTVSVTALIAAALSLVSAAHDQESVAMAMDETSDEPDDSRIIFEDWDLFVDLAKEMETFQKDEFAFKEDEKAYSKEMSELSINKSRYENEMAEFLKEKLNLEKKKKEYEEAGKVVDANFLHETNELEKEESDLSNLEKEVERQEKELAQQEKEETRLNMEVNEKNEKLTQREMELNKLMEDLRNLEQKLQRETKAEEKHLQAKHGECIDIPESFVMYVKNYEEGNSKLCYKLSADDYD